MNQLLKGVLIGASSVAFLRMIFHKPKTPKPEFNATSEKFRPDLLKSFTEPKKYGTEFWEQK